MLKKRQMSHTLCGEDNISPMNDRMAPFTRAWNYLSNIWPPNNSQLSVTIVNNEILNSNRFLLGNSPTKSKAVLNILQEEAPLIDDLKQRHFKDHIESMLPVSMSRHVLLNHLQDWHIVDDSNPINIRNDVNLIKNSDDTYEVKTMESHSVLHFNETEKTTMKEKIIDGSSDSDSPDVDPQTREVDIHEDTDVESFHVVSHSDVPTVNFMESSMSRLSNMCRNTYNRYRNSWSQLWETDSTRTSVKRPSYLTKQHHRKKAIAIAMGRGRGRGKCQLRRSGVSQTERRKGCIKYDDPETWQNNLVATVPNDCSLDSKLDSLDYIDISDLTQVTKQIDSSAMSNSPNGGTPIKEKSKARKKKKTKVKYMTKVHCIPNSSRMNDYNYYENNNSEMPEAQENSFRSRTLSESSTDFEDWIVFEEDQELHETCEKRGTTECSIRVRYVPNSLMNKINNLENDSNCKTHDAERVPFRFWSLSESSEDSNYNSIAPDEHEMIECPKMRYDCLTKISEKHRKDSDNSNNSFVTEEGDDIDGCDKTSFHCGDSQLEDDSIIFTDEDSEESISQTKKVSFDPTPVVHVMVTWNYAYRAARRGPWEEIARDNERFRGRINSIAIVLNPVLKSKHRSQVWQERFAPISGINLA